MEILDTLKEHTSISNIGTIQITRESCLITLKNTEYKDKLKQSFLNINGQNVSLTDVDSSITNVTVKDLPTELEDSVIAERMSNFGEVAHGSLCRGIVRGTTIFNGTRYLALRNVKDTVPTELSFDQFIGRVYCDNNKTECRHCQSAEHPFYKCPSRVADRQTTKRCFRSFSTSHVIGDCNNEVTCNLCFQSGHKKNVCPDKELLTERERCGDYIHEIREGGDSAIDEQHIEAMVAQNRQLDTDKKPDVPIEQSKDTKTMEAIGGCRPKVPN